MATPGAMTGRSTIDQADAPGGDPPPDEGEIRVVVIDDEPIIRSAVGALIRSTPGLTFIGEANDAPSGLELIERTEPDVALVDVRMSGGGQSLTNEIRLRRLATRIVVLSAHSDRETVVDMLAAGASAYVVKGAPLEQIVDAIRAASGGRGALEERIVPDVVDELSERVRRERRLALNRQRVRERIEAAVAVGPRIVYQPIIELGTGQLVGHEALARFDLPPVRTPDRWFREAAKVGRLFEIERRTLGLVLGGIRPTGSYVSVNVHPATLTASGWWSWMHRQDWTGIVVEVTEHDTVLDWRGLSGALDALRSRGARISVDDAGSGYSSLRRILQIRPDLIKLDADLTTGIDADPARRALATAVQGFGAELGADVIAEGIETRAEEAVVRQLGIRYGQGFLLGRPGPIDVPLP